MVILFSFQQFNIYPDSEFEFDPNSTQELTIVTEPLDLTLYPDGPPKATAVETILYLSTNIPDIAVKVIPITATLVDVY
jgi:hypothetical protein